MLSVLADRTYRHLFAAQVLSLVGTGLTTVALGLLAWELAGADAGVVLGVALALKMVAYVGIAPIAGALAGRVPRRAFLVGLDLARATMVLFLPFVTEVWQVLVLVFAFQACSAAFTPTFQATIPDVLPKEADYTKALSLSRLAYDLEALLSPMLAGVLLTVMSFHWLFVGNVLGFLASAALVVSVALPVIRAGGTPRPFLERVTRGSWIYLATPRLRGLLALSFAVASAGAMVIVNTVVVVKDRLGGTDSDVALGFAAYGLGSMAVALALPRLLGARADGTVRLSPRTVMLAGAALLPAGLLVASLLVAGRLAGSVAPSLPGLLALWAVLGVGSSLVQTPAGLLLRRSSHDEDRPALFAAQFALSHACWLVTYPAAGVLGVAIGLPATLLVMAAAAAAGLVVAALVWPAPEPEAIPHAHPDLPPGHAHLAAEGPREHRHPVVIDDLHRHWPDMRAAAR